MTLLLAVVLAIGDLAGATFVTLLAATATQFARAGRLREIEVCRAAGLVGNDLAIDGRAPRDGMSNPSTRRVAQKIRGNHSLR